MTMDLTEEELNDLRGIAGFLEAEGMPYSADSILKLIDRLTAPSPTPDTAQADAQRQRMQEILDEQLARPGLDGSVHVAAAPPQMTGKLSGDNQ